MNFRIITFGCKLNQAESNMISADLIMAGFKLDNKNPDLIIINACAVTHKAVKEGRQKVAQLKRKYPKAKIVVTGCVVENNWKGVDLWVKTEFILSSHFFQKMRVKDPVTSGTDNDILRRLEAPQDKLRNRALIKIQTGCDNFCTYCIVPFMRGKPISRPMNKIISEILEKEKQGFKEIVLTGVNIGLYDHKNIKSLKHKNKKMNYGKGLNYLLKEILNKIFIERIRLGSLWPTHITKDLIDLYSKNQRLCPHFHLSIQSGSNKILKSMGRDYKISDIKNIIKKCRVKIPNINFTCDIIVGFPGETDKDFQDSVKLIKDIGFSKVHVFKYSKRPQTKAVDFPNQVDEKTKNERSQKLIKFADKIAIQTKKKFINKRLLVLWESKKASYYYGFTENYIWVKKKVKKGEKLENKIEQTKLISQMIADSR